MKVNSVSNKVNTPKQNQQQFGGIADYALLAMQTCEKHPMLNVSVIDGTTSIFPRSIYDGTHTNIFAGIEAFLRESSGLIVNCLIPGVIVRGVSKLIQKFSHNNYNKSQLSNIWANSESIGVAKDYLKDAHGEGAEKLSNAMKAFCNDLTGIDGTDKKAFKDFNLSEKIDNLAKLYNSDKSKEKEVAKAMEELVEELHMTEHLELNNASAKNKVLSKNLQSYLDDFMKLFKSAEENNIKTPSQWEEYAKQMVKHINKKSFIGLAIIIPLAMSMQPINRFITRKLSGKKGAPIYQDFTQDKEDRKLTKQEKIDLLKQKMISVGSMLFVTFLSMGCKLPTKQMLQFKGIFPTMDQARIISTATFVSRMLTSEDKIELKEATVRDIATYSGLYFLGDYAAKAIATICEKIKPEVKLLNHNKPLEANSGIGKKVLHWLKDVSLKTSNEMGTKQAKNLRSLCQFGNLLFSFMILGLIIPQYTRHKTDKRRAEELNLNTKDIANRFFQNQVKNNSPAFSSFFD